MRWKIAFAAALLLALALPAAAQATAQAWLDRPVLKGTNGPLFGWPVRALGHDPLEQTGARELLEGSLRIHGIGAVSNRGFTHEIVLGTSAEWRAAYPAAPIPASLAPEAYAILTHSHHGRSFVFVAGGSSRGVLYGAFALLRLLAQGTPLRSLAARSAPAYPIRWLDDWDNLDGSIERGYAGRSLFFEDGRVRADLEPVRQYARLAASIGINAVNLNNVNNAAPFLEPKMLQDLARVANTMRPSGVRVALSVDIASPQKLGGLPTFDPLDPAVKTWWARKTAEIYALIPDFAGFTVKADSEGQPGPASYGRTPADAANLLAAALAPHGGVVLYRAFVYNHHLDPRDPHADRARAAYDIFHPLDGKFAPNVLVQTKEGPIDFQAREPVSPLFAGLPHTRQAMELQITQEYTGQQRHLVYLAPMWQEVLATDLRIAGQAAPVSAQLTGLVGVSGVGRNAFLGAPLALANLYAFGRLAWDPTLAPRSIAEEWTRQTLGGDALVVHTVVDMLLKSWPAYERYTGPLGLQTLTDIIGSHYGPNIESSENNGWGQWHRADAQGVGMDRSVATGTGFAGQYPPALARLYEDPATTPDGLLLFFHHLPYTARLSTGKTILQTLYDDHYDGAAQAARFVRDWESLQGRIDPGLYSDELALLRYQAGHAIVWRDAVNQYFLKRSGIPDAQGRVGVFPGRLEAEDAHLTGYTIIDVDPWEDASRGKAVTCAPFATTGKAQPEKQPAAGTASNDHISTAETHSPSSASDSSSPASDSSSSASHGPSAEGYGLQPVHPASLQKGALAPEGNRCTAAWTYTGPAGRFDIATQYFDLAGGSAQFSLQVTGATGPARNIAHWVADAQLPTARPHGDNSTRFVAAGIALQPGDILRLQARPDDADPAALDYIELTPATAPEAPPASHPQRGRAFLR